MQKAVTSHRHRMVDSNQRTGFSCCTEVHRGQAFSEITAPLLLCPPPRMQLLLWLL